mmetsp:Transcript_11463/g.30332  ORF Transcript_11463/g.30332 Transcript_11463/m.30332 type:complete len:165 (+) Transcript_11463:993-1487(+)
MMNLSLYREPRQALLIGMLFLLLGMLYRCCEDLLRVSDDISVILGECAVQCLHLRCEQIDTRFDIVRTSDFAAKQRNPIEQMLHAFRSLFEQSSDILDPWRGGHRLIRIRRSCQTRHASMHVLRTYAPTTTQLTELLLNTPLECLSSSTRAWLGRRAADGGRLG